MIDQVDWIETHFDSPVCRIGRLEDFSDAVIRQHGGQLPVLEREFNDDPTQFGSRAQARLAEVLAYLGDTESAIALAREAMEALPTAEDAVQGPHVHLAAINAFVAAGAYDTAVEELDAYLAAPGHMSVEGAATDPRLRPIRDDPRFQALLEQYGRRQ